jgi:hypothetical protein
VKPRAVINKKPQTFVLRIWERAEGKRYELRNLAGQRKTFKNLGDIEHHLQALAHEVSEQEVTF